MSQVPMHTAGNMFKKQHHGRIHIGVRWPWQRRPWWTDLPSLEVDKHLVFGCSPRRHQSGCTFKHWTIMVLEISKKKLQLPRLSNFFRKKNKEETADVVTVTTAEHRLAHHSSWHHTPWQSSGGGHGGGPWGIVWRWDNDGLRLKAGVRLDTSSASAAPVLTCLNTTLETYRTTSKTSAKSRLTHQLY